MKLPSPITITDVMQKEWTSDSVEAIGDFFKNQADFWSSHASLSGTNPTANHYIQRHIEFRNISNQIDAWKPQLESWDSSALISNFNSIINPFSSNSWLWSGHPIVKKWLELNQISNSTADAFFEATVQKSTSRFASGMEFFQGYLVAYEYINQGKANINKRRKSEDKALAELREQLTTKNNELIGNVSEFESEITKWKVKTESDFSGWFGKQVTFLDEAVLSHSKNFHEQFAIWTENKGELEKKYREELRFESAAEFWGKKVISFKTQGYWWTGALGISLLLGVGLFSKYFLTWLSGQPSGLGLQSIEGVLIFAAALSTYAFLIKALSKLTFSAFHLQRDAEEREQLTHLYLNLREGKDDDVESRKIILQALFSRSETGLLSGEHGPTMPTATEFINIIGKSR